MALYVVFMDEIDFAKANLIAAKRSLDEAHADYVDALKRLERQTKISEIEQWEQTKTGRLPKGQVEEMIKLIFVRGTRYPLTTHEVTDRVSSLLGRQVSQITVRQNLNLLLKQRKLEKSHGSWTRGQYLD